ncbi:hypothetical protein NX722_09020 [Endozoicomonas gorgoniicola]|uniref:Uncharacterized protein n=1 Tax=Endozoicomonas gorgoniicola TaxID=1234144 RepID=A0ABT3MTS0_9GAMM|nr:hypothetical protein [Endozoicomonas gorgoniicola]MCW7552781.1 hypothetical protein [Endozoicomonas gorgoniicola]
MDSTTSRNSHFGLSGSPPSLHDRSENQNYQGMRDRSRGRRSHFRGRTTTSMPASQTASSHSGRREASIATRSTRQQASSSSVETPEQKHERLSNDTTHLRMACFLGDLYFQNKTLFNKSVTAEQVIEEFDKSPNQTKCVLQKGVFLRKLFFNNHTLNGHPVPPEDVLSVFKIAKASEEIAYFYRNLCFQGIRVHGEPVKPEKVMSLLAPIKSPYVKGKFLEGLFLNKIPLESGPVTSQMVLDEYTRVDADREIDQFLEKARPYEDITPSFHQARSTSEHEPKVFSAFVCRPKKLTPPSANRQRDHSETQPETETPEQKYERQLSDKTSYRRASLLRELYEEGRTIYGGPVTALMVVEEYDKSPNQRKCTLAKGVFLQSLFFHNRLLNGRPVTAEYVISVLERAQGIKELAYFYSFLCLNRIPVNGNPVTPESVMEMIEQKGTAVMKARFLESLFWGAFPLWSKSISADQVVAEYKKSLDSEAQGRFLEMLCLNGIPLKNGPVTGDSVEQFYQQSPQSQIIFHAKLCLAKMPLNGQLVTPEMVIKELGEHTSTREIKARFLKDLCLEEIKLNGELVSPNSVITAYEDAKAEKELNWFMGELCQKERLLDHDQVKPETIVEKLKQPGNSLELARFYRKMYEAGIQLHGEFIQPETVYEAYQAVPDYIDSKQLELAHFKEYLFFERTCLYHDPVAAEHVEAAFGKAETETFRQARAHFLRRLCLHDIMLNGQCPTPEAVRDLFPATMSGRMDLARFLQELFLKGTKLDKKPIASKDVVSAFPETNEGRLGVARFLQELCLNNIKMNGRFVKPETVMKKLQETGCELEQARFLQALLLKGIKLNHKEVSPEKVASLFPDTGEGHLGLSCFLQQLCLKKINLNGKAVSPEEIIQQLEQRNAFLQHGLLLQKLCLQKRPIKGMLVKPEAVVEKLKQAGATLEQGCFLEELCFRGIPLNGQPVKPETVIDYYQKNRCHLEKTKFIGHLAVSGKATDIRISDDSVLKGFYELPVSTEAHQIDYLLKRVQTHPSGNEEKRLQLYQEAVRLIDDNNYTFDKGYYSVLVKTRALLYGLPAYPAGSELTPDTIARDIRQMPVSEQIIQLRFFFLAECYFQQWLLDGTQVSRAQVKASLRDLPASKVKTALLYWFDEQCQQPGKKKPPAPEDNPVKTQRSDKHRKREQQKAAQPASARKSPAPQVTQPTVQAAGALPLSMMAPESRHSTSSRVLSLINEINNLYPSPVIVTTRCLSNYAQGNDDQINLIGTNAGIEKLAEKIHNEFNSQNDDEPEIPSQCLFWSTPGSRELHLPRKVSMTFTTARIRTELVVKVETYPVLPVVTEDAGTGLQGQSQPIASIPFCSLEDEAVLLAERINHLNEHLLTPEFLNTKLYVPQSVIFYDDGSSVFAILMHTMMSLNKAEELLLEQEPPLNTRYKQILKSSMEPLKSKIKQHPEAKGFIKALESWLTNTTPNNNYEQERYAFVQKIKDQALSLLRT